MGVKSVGHWNQAMYDGMREGVERLQDTLNNSKNETPLMRVDKYRIQNREFGIIRVSLFDANANDKRHYQCLYISPFKASTSRLY
jgi:hypothetical protein